MKQIKTIAFGGMIALTLFANTVSAAETGVFKLTEDITGWIEKIIPVLFAVALLTLLFGLVRFLFNNGNDDAVADGKRIMIWGLVAMFVMASVWGIVKFGQTSFGLEDKNTLEDIPKVTFPVI